MSDFEIGKTDFTTDNTYGKKKIPPDMQLKRQGIIDLLSEFRCAVEDDLDTLSKMNECKLLMSELQHHIQYLKQKVDKYATELKIMNEKKTEGFDEGKQIEDLLHGSKEKLHPITICTCAWESWIGCDGKPVWVNSAVERITGYSPIECIRMEGYPLPLIIPEDRTRMAEAFESALSQESANDVEFRIQKKMVL